MTDEARNVVEVFDYSRYIRAWKSPQSEVAAMRIRNSRRDPNLIKNVLIARAEIHKNLTAIDQAGKNLLLRIGTSNSSRTLPAARIVKITTPIRLNDMANENQNSTTEELPKAVISVNEGTTKVMESVMISIQPEDPSARQEELTRLHDAYCRRTRRMEIKIKSQWL